MDNAQVGELLPLLKALSKKYPTIQYRENEVGVQVWVTDGAGRKHPFFVDVDGKAVNPTIDFLIAASEVVGMFFFLFPAFRTTDMALAGWGARYSRIDIPAGHQVGGEFPTQLEASAKACIDSIKHHLEVSQ